MPARRTAGARWAGVTAGGKGAPRHRPRPLRVPSHRTGRAEAGSLRGAAMPPPAPRPQARHADWAFHTLACGRTPWAACAVAAQRTTCEGRPPGAARRGRGLPSPPERTCSGTSSARLRLQRCRPGGCAQRATVRAGMPPGSGPSRVLDVRTLDRTCAFAPPGGLAARAVATEDHQSIRCARQQAVLLAARPSLRAQWVRMWKLLHSDSRSARLGGSATYRRSNARPRPSSRRPWLRPWSEHRQQTYFPPWHRPAGRQSERL